MTEPADGSDGTTGGAGTSSRAASPGVGGAAARRRGVPADVVDFVRSQNLTRKSPVESAARLVFTFVAIGALGAAAVATSFMSVLSRTSPVVWKSSVCPCWTVMPVFTHPALAGTWIRPVPAASPSLEVPLLVVPELLPGRAK